MSNIQDSIEQTPALPAKVYLINESLGTTGGIETLIVRMANFFVLSGINVAIICKSGGELQSLLDSRISIISFIETNDLIKNFHSHLVPKYPKHKVLIISFDPISAARGLMVETSFNDNFEVIHISGVFHPRAYFFSFERRDRIFLNYLVARAIGKDYLFFMNKECRANHSLKWRTDLSSCPILTLPINHVDKIWKPTDKTILRIISVGRLVDFKAYNLGAAKIVRTCLDHGVEIYWDIFGDGPLYNLIQAEIEIWNVAHNVFLRGSLDYADFPTKVAEYDLFIGMGTAALEAAMIGVPTICATDSEPTRCYGYIQDLPFGNVGELQSFPPTVEIADILQSYSTAQLGHRTWLSKQGREVAEKYGMPKFAEALANMTTIRKPPPPWLAKRMIAKIYCFATESIFVKKIRKIQSYLLKKRSQI